MGCPAVLRPCQHEKLARGAQAKEHAMSQKLESAVAVIGIDIGKNSFHVVGHDEHGTIRAAAEVVTWPVEARFTNMPTCLIGTEACVGAHLRAGKVSPASSEAAH
jgi:transposase